MAKMAKLFRNGSVQVVFEVLSGLSITRSGVATGYGLVHFPEQHELVGGRGKISVCFFSLGKVSPFPLRNRPLTPIVDGPCPE